MSSDSHVFNLELDDIEPMEWHSPKEVYELLKVTKNEDIDKSYKAIDNPIDRINVHFRQFRYGGRGKFGKFDIDEAENYYNALTEIESEISNIEADFLDVSKHRNELDGAIDELLNTFYLGLIDGIWQLELSIKQSKMYKFYKSCYSFYERMKLLST